MTAFGPITMIELRPFSFSDLGSFGVHLGTRHLDGKSWDPYARQSHCNSTMKLQTETGKGIVVRCERCNLTLYSNHINARMLWALMTIEAQAIQNHADAPVLTDPELLKFLPHGGQKTTLDLMGRREDYVIWEKSWDHNVGVLFPITWTPNETTIAKITAAGLYVIKTLGDMHSQVIQEAAEKSHSKFGWMYNQ